jgi:hypothetical protein
MVPLYTARIEDLGPGDFVKVDRAACSHTALLILGVHNTGHNGLGRRPFSESSRTKLWITLRRASGVMMVSSPRTCVPRLISLANLRTAMKARSARQGARIDV